MTSPLIVIDARTVEGQYTGIGRYVTSLVPEMIRMRLDWRFHLFAAAGREELFSGLPGRVTVEGVPPVPHHPASDFWMHVTLPGWLNTHGASVYFSAANYLPAFSGGARRVVTIHDLGPYRYPGHDPLKFTLYLKASYRLCAWVADAVVTDSRNTAEECERFLGIESSRLHVVHLGVPPMFRRLDAASLESIVAARPGLAGLPPRFVLAVGAHVPRKNLVRLIAALPRLRERHPLVLAGPTGLARARAEDQARSLGLADRVHFVDYPDDEGLVALYNMAALFVHPSLYEGFGLPVLEAMACGTPVACSDVASIPEVAGDAASMFDPTSEESIAAGMARVLDDPGHAAELSRRGLAQAARFTWERTAAGTIDVIERLR